MKKLEDIQKIVNYSKLGWSDVKIAEEFEISRTTVRKYRKRYWKAQEDMISSNPEKGLQAIQDVLTAENKPKKGRKPYKYKPEIDALLDEILEEEDQRAVVEGVDYKPSPKTQIYRRIREAGFDIGYTTISKKIDAKRLARSNIGPWKSMDPDS